MRSAGRCAALQSALTRAHRPLPPLLQAVEVYTDMGRLNMAARQLKEIAEAQEKQGLKEEAITFYNQVGAWQKGPRQKGPRRKGAGGSMAAEAQGCTPA